MVKRFKTFDGIEIAYREWGGAQSTLPPVVLHHGFIVDAETNWVLPGIVAGLLADGRRVIAPDARGHGSSEKPHDPARYGEQQMARDLEVLLDTAGVEQIDLAGYSMGAIVCLLFASAHAPRVRRLVIGGIGSGVIECGGVDRRAVPNEQIIRALSAREEGELEDPVARVFRALADALGADRDALVAQASSIYRGEIALDEISAPTLLIAGDADPLALRPEMLAAALPCATLAIVAGDHTAAVSDPRFTRELVDFLGHGGDGAVEHG